MVSTSRVPERMDGYGEVGSSCTSTSIELRMTAAWQIQTGTGNALTSPFVAMRWECWSQISSIAAPL